MEEVVRQKNKRVVIALLVLIVGMVGVGVALIPLYDVFTEASGINGKVEVTTQTLNFKVDQSRVIHLDLITSVAKDTPLKFSVVTTALQAHPGQAVLVQYTALNTSANAIKGHASASVAPGLSAQHFKLLDCFCLGSQDFAAGETKSLQLQFVIDPKLPIETRNIALALQFFKTK